MRHSSSACTIAIVRRQTRIGAVLVMVVVRAAPPRRRTGRCRDAGARAGGRGPARRSHHAAAGLARRVARKQRRPRPARHGAVLGRTLRRGAAGARAGPRPRAPRTATPCRPASTSSCGRVIPNGPRSWRGAGLRQRPERSDVSAGRARALVALKRPTEARDTLERLLVIDPRNEQALRDAAQPAGEPAPLAGARRLRPTMTFSDRRVAWRESQVSLSRTTPIGSIIVRGSRARNGSGFTDNQFEVEMYPRLQAGHLRLRRRRVFAGRRPLSAIPLCGGSLSEPRRRIRGVGGIPPARLRQRREHLRRFAQQVLRQLAVHRTRSS